MSANRHHVPFSIPQHWNAGCLADVCDDSGLIQTGPFGSQLHASDYVEIGIPSIMPVNIGDGQIIAEAIKCVSEQDAQRLLRHRVQLGDIVFSRRGDVERHGFVTESEVGWLCGTGCLLVRFNNTVVIPKFGSYWLRHSEIRTWISSHAVGSTMPNLNTSIMKSVPFALPPKDEQRAIVRILGALDDKIELNRQMNVTLEQMARSLFKSWFVDFDPITAKAAGRPPFGMSADLAALFPDRFVDSSLGPIPEGWRMSNVGKECEFKYGKSLPEKNRKVGDIPVYGSNGIVGWHNEFLVPGPGIIVGRKGTAGAITWSHSNSYPIDTTFFVRPPIDKDTSMYFLYEMLKEADLVSLTGDSAVPGLNRDLAYTRELVMPPPILIDEFTRFVEPLSTQKKENDKESVALRNIRDTLLPQLLSGKIRLQDAEKIAEEVA